MWQLEMTPLRRTVIAAGKLVGDNGTLSFADAFEAWRRDPAFREFWHERLRGVRYAGFCWECPALTAASLDRPFECVFVESPALVGRAPDPAPFAEHFRAAPPAGGVASVATFPSLGKDSLLVAPRPGGPGSDFSHLARFAATATPSQASDLWEAVGLALESRLGTAPTWLSTAGLGVDWLHVRLDSRPKYYRHSPYAR